jgi:sugar O-acyltransferase (sialic acid O-acetyltransferase NeuD family)
MDLSQSAYSSYRSHPAKFAVIGTGGHAFSVLDILESSGLFPEFLVSDRENQREKWGIPVIPESQLHTFSSTHDFVLGLGAQKFRLPWLTTKYSEVFSMPTVFHRNSYVSNRASFGIGSTVHSYAHIGPGVKVGNFCIINSGASVDHDVELGNNVIISPGATIAGGAKLGDGTFIGMGALVAENTCIGDLSVIGANTFVNSDFPAASRVFGTPGKFKP